MYEIVYQSEHTREVVDTASDIEEAQELQLNYQMAFKTNFIYIQ